MLNNLNLLVNIITNQQQANQAAQSLDAIGISADKTTKAFRSLTAEGRNLRMLGSELAISAAAVLGPLTLAADQYAKRYAGIEKQANDFVAAQRRQTNSTSDLGRAVSGLLIPKLEQLSAITEHIANFTTQHPEIVGTAVDIASAAAVGGATLIALGQATTMLGRIQRVAQSGDITGQVLTLGLYTAAFTAGLKGGEIAVNLLGKAFDDTRLQSYTLADSLVTVRQLLAIIAGLLPDATKTAARIVEIGVGTETQFFAVIQKWDIYLKAAAGAVETAFIDAAARFVKAMAEKFGLTNLASIVNGPLSSHDNSIAETKFDIKVRTSGLDQSVQDQLIQKRHEEGQSGTFTAADQKYYDSLIESAKAIQAVDAKTKKVGENLALFDRVLTQGTDDWKKGLGPILEEFVKTGRLPGGVSNLLDGIAQLFNPKGGVSPATADPTKDPEALKAYIDYRKAVTKAVKDETTAEAEAYSKLGEANTKTDRNEKEQEDKINSDFAEKQFKDLRKFNENESKEDAKYVKERAKKEKDLNDNLLELAAARDVAGFILAQKNTEKELTKMATDQADAKAERLANFNEQQADAKDQHDKQLQDARNAAQKEKNERQLAYNEQIAQLRQHLKDQKQELLQAFAEQIAVIAPAIAGLGDLSVSIMKGQMTEFTNWAATHSTDLRNAFAQAFGVNAPGMTVPTVNLPKSSTKSGNTSVATSSGTIGGPITVTHDLTDQLGIGHGPTPITNPPKLYFPIPDSFMTQSTKDSSYASMLAGKLGIPSYASGVTYLPKDGLYFGHRGEKITRSADVKPDISLTVGDIHIGANNHVTRDDVRAEFGAAISHLTDILPGMVLKQPEGIVG